jgi:nucleoside-diphosphate-sugar epimerase
MPRSVLVTGGFGFIGAHVVQALLAAGDSVTVVDRELHGNAAHDILTPDELAAVEQVASSFLDVQGLVELLDRRSVTAIVHLASPLATRTERAPGTVVDEMIDPHRAILDACTGAEIGRLVFASSVGVFGRISDYPTLPISNDAPHVPQTLYGAGKAFLEQLTQQYAACHTISALGLRFPLVYGPGRRRGGGQFTTELIEGMALGERTVVTNADQKNDWLFVADAARSVLLALDSDASGAVTVTGGVATTRQVAELLQGWFPDTELTLAAGSSDLVAEFEPTAALDAIGYQPLFSLSDGVLRTANAARQRAGLAGVAT